MNTRKRKWLLSLFLVIGLLTGLMFVPPVRDEIDWRLARLRHTERGYGAYQKAHPHGRHSLEVSNLALITWLGASPRPQVPDWLFWMWSRADGSPEACIEYLAMWPQGKFRDAANQRLDRLRWAEATGEHTVASYQRYLDDVDEGPHRKDAEARVKQLQQDDRPFLLASAQNSERTWTEFLAEFRGHRRSGEALARLAEIEPNSIFRLARDGELTISAQGDALYRFGVVLHKRRPESLPLSVPRGLYWKAKNPAVMDMVATHGFDSTLDQTGEIWCPTPAASATMRKRLPTYNDQFTVLPTPPDENLARLIAFFAFKMPEFRLRQAAIWVVTGDARWKDLKRHMNGQTGADPLLHTGDEERSFDPEELIDVIMILDAAGLDSRRYAVWREDREPLFWEILARDAAWEYLLETDPEGLGRKWTEMKTALTARLRDVESRVLPVLKAKPFEVTVYAPPSSPEAAWLAWYMRALGHEVDIEKEPEYVPENTSISGLRELPRESRAAADLLEAAFGLKGRTEDAFEIAFKTGRLDVNIAPMGSNDAEKERKSGDHTPKWLRWIP